MKGKEMKKEKKTEKKDGSATKVKSDYQSEKTRKSTTDTITPKAKK